MQMVGIGKTGMTPNRYLYNAQTEREESFGLQWDETPFRRYDPQLGRFHGVDALAAMMPGITPYQYAFNNPVMLNDPSGLAPSGERNEDAEALSTARRWKAEAEVKQWELEDSGIGGNIERVNSRQGEVSVSSSNTTANQLSVSNRVNNGCPDCPNPFISNVKEYSTFNSKDGNTYVLIGTDWVKVEGNRTTKDNRSTKGGFPLHVESSPDNNEVIPTIELDYSKLPETLKKMLANAAKEYSEDKGYVGLVIGPTAAKLGEYYSRNTFKNPKIPIIRNIPYSTRKEFLKYLKATGKVLARVNYAAVIIRWSTDSGYSTGEAIADLVMTRVAMVPGWGWAAGAAYFLGYKLIYKNVIKK